MRVLVIGGVNMDVGGKTDRHLVFGDSNPGQVRTSLGGVGFNIARNLCLMGVETSMLTVLGDDETAERVRREAEKVGLDMSLCPVVQGGRTGTYFYLLNEDGDMMVAVNDMAIYNYLTPALLARNMNAINSFDLVILDTNLPQKSIDYLFAFCRVPVLADPVSTIKAEKLRNVIGKLYAIKPNRLEAEALTGETEPEKMAEKLLSWGVKKVFISLSEEGVYAADPKERCHISCPKVKLVNATGAGDAMTASLAACILRYESLAETAKYAVTAGTLACMAAETVSPQMSWRNMEKLREREGF